MNKLRTAFAIANMLVLVLIFGAARTMGAHWNLIVVYLMLMAVVGGVVRLVHWYRGSLDWSMYGSEDTVGDRWQTGIRVVGWLIAGAALHMAIVQVQFPDDLWSVRAQMLVLVLIAVAYAFIPTPHRNWWGTIGVAVVGVVFLWDMLAGVKKPPLNQQVRSPFEVPAVVFHGGGSPLLNHHSGIRPQKFAVDLVLAPNGSELVGDRTTLEGWACFGAPVVAVADGTVVTARDGLPDQAIGQTDTENLAGNHVVVQIGDERYALYAHLKQGSIVVSEGDRVAAGAVLGGCGNSGNTSQPHLHLQVQNTPDFSNHDVRQRTFGLLFDKVERRGRQKTHAFARRNDEILP